ncbi:MULTISPECIES: hypothetical protein [Streptomyces]|uniref:hypothetical protein n=1 Tax=Streptomyces TaxID=1883 RepID=UPI000851B837|nr:MULTISPECIES: hypothetical protein [unclassified Streptomyces]MDX3486850.1 hypothetical protein [Streptomyces sp. ID05-18]
MVDVEAPLFAILGTALILGVVCVLFLLAVGVRPRDLFGSKPKKTKKPGDSIRFEFDNRPRKTGTHDGAGGDFGHGEESGSGDGGGD